MVQFRRSVYNAQGECKDYWKLTPAVGMRAFLLESLQQRGVKFPKGLSKARLSCISLRVQRGLMVYDSRGVSELRSFAASRNLNIPDLNRYKKWDLIAHLERADEEATFTRFEELPAELRVHIYELHLQGLKTDAIIPTQPPITKVSRLLRKESLPLFYKICKFEAIILSGGFPSNATQLFFSDAPVEVLEKIRELHILGEVMVIRHFAFHFASLKFTLRDAGDDLSFADGGGRHPLPEWGLEVLKERVQNSGIPNRDKKLRLRRTDIDALANLLELGLEFK